MGASLEEALAEDMAERKARGLLRRAVPQGAGPVDFQSNDYLGLARDPRVVEGARRALEAHGAGGRASRLLGGGAKLFEEVESLASRRQPRHERSPQRGAPIDADDHEARPEAQQHEGCDHEEELINAITSKHSLCCYYEALD